MSRLGKVIALPNKQPYISGMRGVLPGGKVAVFGPSRCYKCCLGGIRLRWEFEDYGGIAGGQNGDRRIYQNPGDVPAPLWSMEQFENGLRVRLSFEDDYNCMNYNEYGQLGIFRLWITVYSPEFLLTVNWHGIGERNWEEGEKMGIVLGQNQIATAHSPGGGAGCGAMGPMVSDPEPPTENIITGPSDWFFGIEGYTIDGAYHTGAFFQWEITFEEL